MAPKYRLKDDFERYAAGEELPPEEVDRYLKCYPYMLEVIGETGEVAAPGVDEIATAKANIEKKRRKTADGEGKLTATGKSGSDKSEPFSIDAKDAKTTK